jgi:hypothetical protein
MARWLARGVALVGIGGAVAVGGGAAAYAAGPSGTSAQDPVSSLTKQLPTALPSLPGVDPNDLGKQLQQGAQQLTGALPSGLPLPPLPSKLPLDLSGLVPKAPLVCGIGIGIGGPINGSCPDSGQKVTTVTKPVPSVIRKTVVVQQPAKPAPTKVVAVPVPVNYPQQVAAAPTGKLAYTGFETGPVLAAGLAALIGGVVLTACARPRRSAS